MNGNILNRRGAQKNQIKTKIFVTESTEKNMRNAEKFKHNKLLFSVSSVFSVAELRSCLFLSFCK